MNFIVISPCYPVNFQQFSIALHKEGVCVLGIGHESYDELSQELKGALTEYFRVSSLENKEEVKRAVAFFFYKYGKIDRIESHNEHWLELDACLREQFCVWGLKPADLPLTKNKSEMKKRFLQANIPVVPGAVAGSTQEVQEVVKKLSLPLFAKMDKGVGAAKSYTLRTEKDVQSFLTEFSSVPYFLETLVEDADIYTYDGLLDTEGKIVLEMGLVYAYTPMQLLNEKKDIAYLPQISLPKDLRSLGRRIVEAFAQKERFFHIEFFKTKEGQWWAIEYNNRAPGAYLVDFYNVAFSRSLYEDYAKVVTGQSLRPLEKMQATLAITRRQSSAYVKTEEEILQTYGTKLNYKLKNPSIFSDLQGDDTYIFTLSSEAELQHLKEIFEEKRV